MTELELLYAAVRAMPDDDTLRLALADYLDAMDTVYPRCDNCNGTRWEPGREGHERCSDCMGVGPDTSNRDRAELIRVQCEWDRLKSIANPNTDEGRAETVRVLGLDARAAIILAANADRWRKGPVCNFCEGKGTLLGCAGDRHNPDCPDCFGTGDAGGLMRCRESSKSRYTCGQCMTVSDHPWVTAPLLCPYCQSDNLHKNPDQPTAYWEHPVTYHRGMKRVECRAADVWERKVDKCHGCGADVGKPCAPMCDEVRGIVWRPTPWARAVCRHHPDVVEMWLDLPFDGGHDGGEYSWLKSSLPLDVFESIEGHPNEPTAARTALARAVVLWVHQHLAQEVRT